MLTLIFAYVFQCKCQAGVFALHYPHFSKGTFAHDPEKSKVVEIDCLANYELARHSCSSAAGLPGGAERPLKAWLDETGFGGRQRTFISEDNLLAVGVSHLN